MTPASLLCLPMWQWAKLAEVSAAMVVVERSVVAMEGVARGQAA